MRSNSHSNTHTQHCSTFAQVITQYLNVTGAPLPSLYRRFLNRIDFVNFDLMWLIPVGCYVHVDFYQKLLLSTVTPIVLMALVFSPRMVSTLLTRAGRPLHATSQRRLGLESSNDVRALLVFTFWIFSSVSTTVLATFACDSSLDGGASYLRADYSVQCYTIKHNVYRVYAAVMIFVYPLGVPLLYSVFLYRERKLVREAHHGAVNYAEKSTKLPNTEFLWEPYRPKVFYWEVCECGRRILLTGMLAFVFPNTAGQSAVACALAFFTILLHGFVQPHASTDDSVTYTMGSAVVFVTMFTALLTESRFADDGSQYVISILLIVLNASLAVMALYEGIKASKSGFVTENIAPLFKSNPNLQSNRSNRAHAELSSTQLEVVPASPISNHHDMSSPMA
jgi:hypothetical protein